MYSVKFKSDDGKDFIFGKDGNIVFDMDLGEGIASNLYTTQGFSQVGETVQGRSVGGRTINVKGAILGNIQNGKSRLRSVFTPFSSGTLFFENQYKTRVFVKQSPSFSPVKNNGKFTMQFFAPFPFFYTMQEKINTIGSFLPMFSFPVNYANPHQFGKTQTGGYLLLKNDGDVKVPFTINIKCIGRSTNPTVGNLHTFEMLKLNGTLQNGDDVRIWRDENDILKAELKRENEAIDIISWIDEKSNLFELNVGDNLVTISDEEGGADLIGRISYSPAVVSIYES